MNEQTELTTEFSLVMSSLLKMASIFKPGHGLLVSRDELTPFKTILHEKLNIVYTFLDMDTYRFEKNLKNLSAIALHTEGSLIE